jgi:hypothetical protein
MFYSEPIHKHFVVFLLLFKSHVLTTVRLTYLSCVRCQVLKESLKKAGNATQFTLSANYAADTG